MHSSGRRKTNKQVKFFRKGRVKRRYRNSLDDERMLWIQMG